MCSNSLEKSEEFVLEDEEDCVFVDAPAPAFTPNVGLV
jgi:hypothetical protein